MKTDKAKNCTNCKYYKENIVGNSLEDCAINYECKKKLPINQQYKLFANYIF